MKTLIFLFLFLFASCEPAYTQISYDRIVSLRDNFYNSTDYSLIDSSKFTLVEVHQTYASGWSSAAKYWNQKFDLRYYPDSSTAAPIGGNLGTLKTFNAFPLDDFIPYLDENHLSDFWHFGTNFSLLQSIYDDFTNAEQTTTDTFYLYLNHENTWYNGIEGERTLFYNSEFLSFVPLHSIYNDTLNDNLNQIFIGIFEIEIQNENTLNNWFDYFNQHKYDPIE